MSTIELRLPVKSYAGRTWVARITGTSEDYGLERDFENPSTRDLNSNRNGTYTYDLSDGVYEVCEAGDRYFIRVGGGDWAMATRADADQAAQAADEALPPVADPAEVQITVTDDDLDAVPVPEEGVQLAESTTTGGGELYREMTRAGAAYRILQAVHDRLSEARGPQVRAHLEAIQAELGARRGARNVASRRFYEALGKPRGRKVLTAFNRGAVDAFCTKEAARHLKAIGLDA